MISSGILTLVAIAGLVVAFVVVLGRRGSAGALVTLCWVPLAALILGFAVHQRLGYAFLGLLIAILVCSLALALLGAVLIIRAFRTGSGSVRVLALGTVIAAAPFVFLLGAWVFRR